MSGIPLKSGADFYVLEAARMRLHNLGADPTEYGDGLIYFNNSDGNNTSRRARIYDGTTFRSLAFLDEIANNEAFNALVARVGVAEGDIDSLEGRATSLEGRATATEGNLSTLKARVDAFLDGGVDSDAVLENLKEIQAFLDAYDGATSLADMFDAVNTQIADRYTKAEADGRFLKLTGGAINGALRINRGGSLNYITFEVKNVAQGHLGFNGANNPIYIPNTDDAIYPLLHSSNYSDYALPLSGGKTITGSFTLADGVDILNSTKYGFIVFDGTYNMFGAVNSPMILRTNDSSIVHQRRSTNYTILDEGNYSDLITTLNKTLSVANSIIIKGVDATSSRLHFTRVGASYISTPEGGNINFDITSNVSLETSELRITSGSIVRGMSRTVSLGTSNLRWNGIYSDDADFAKKLKIGSIVLSDDNGTLKIDGNAYATGELAAGGAGEEGSDDMGLALLENWADYDATKAQALGAVLGKDMYDRVVTLEGKSTNVQFTPTLSSGKQIGAITIDGVTTGIFAPSSYAWSEIDGRPTNLSQFTDDVVSGNYLPVTEGKIKVNIVMAEGYHVVTRELYAGKDATYDLGNNLRRWANIHTMLINGGTPIHSGNVGEYALKVDGSNAMAKGKYIDWEGSGQNGEDYESFGYGIRILSYDVASSNYRGGLSVGTRYGFQLTRLANDDVDSLTVRFNDPNNGNTWGDWKTIAFTDSDITGNAATATKLKAAVSLWGNEFDGTQDLTRTIMLDNQYPIRWKSSDGSKLDAVVLNSTNNLLLGQGVAKAGFNTYIYGYNISFCYGSAGSVNQAAMTITEEGRVLINRPSAILDRQLSIGNGGVYVSTILAESPVLGSVGSNSLLVGTSTYGMQHWILNNGQGNIQVSRFDGTAIAYALNLNPLGGAVNIASADAPTNVLGTMKVAGLANFSSRVLIGAVTDDTESALQVRGKITVGHSALDRLILTTQDVTAVFDGHDEVDGWMDYVFKSNGTELFYIGAKESATSRFRRAIRFYSTLTVGGNLIAEGASTFGGQSTFNALALFNKPIVAKDTLQIGEATLSWDADKNALKVDKNIYSDGEVSAGGAGEEGETESTGNASAWAQTFTPTNTTMPFEHNRATTDVIVQVYEKNDGGSWDMILVDVEIISETKVNLHFGRTENREHKIVIMG